jgi:hypothetical protein
MDSNNSIYIKNNISDYEYKIIKMLSKLYAFSFILNIIIYDKTKSEIIISF